MIAEKRQALTRRANKLIEWLERPDYAIYAGHESSVQLIKVADLIIWALERSIPLNDWLEFDSQLKGSRFIIADTFLAEDAEREMYNVARMEIVLTLHSYLEFIKTKDIEVVYEE